MKLPQTSRAHAPRKKLRGKERFFRKVKRDAEDFRVPADPGDWRDFWHYHADWDGYGNLGWSYRRRFVAALATGFRAIATTRQSLGAPYQVWILLDGDDAGQDATFFHTPNPQPRWIPLEA